MGVQGFENLAEVAHMIRPHRAIDEDVVKKHQNKFAKRWSEDVVHQTLECGRRIGEAEWHN